jgi:hypothetical protein
MVFLHSGVSGYSLAHVLSKGGHHIHRNAVD